MAEQQRIVLTGASRGIGRAIALEYARHRATMLLVARDGEKLAEVAASIQSLGGTASILPLDLADPEAPSILHRRATELFGDIDIVILNAGRGGPMFADDFDISEAILVTEVNYTSPLRTIALFLPRMIAAGRGQIVAVSSLAAYRGMPGSGPYNASKAALTTAMESLRIDLLGSGVALTTIAPGFVRTAMTDTNEFPMPFLMSPEAAARRIVRAIDHRRSIYRFPLGTSLAVHLLQWLPNVVYDRVMRWGRSRG